MNQSQDEEREISKRLRLIDDFLDDLAVAFPADYLISIGTMGKRCTEEIKKKLEAQGLRLKEDLDR